MKNDTRPPVRARLALVGVFCFKLSLLARVTNESDKKPPALPFLLRDLLQLEKWQNYVAPDRPGLAAGQSASQSASQPPVSQHTHSPSQPLGWPGGAICTNANGFVYVLGGANKKQSYRVAWWPPADREEAKWKTAAPRRAARTAHLLGASGRLSAVVVFVIWFFFATCGPALSRGRESRSAGDEERRASGARR
jgi:hypothetical protein